MALSDNIGVRARSKEGTIQRYSVAGGVKIYSGALLTVALAGATAGYARPAAGTDGGLEQIFIGIAQEGADATLLASGALYVRVRENLKWYCLKASPIQSDVGKLACVYDDETVQLYDAANDNIVVGRITEIEGNNVYVNTADRPARVAVSASD